MSDSAAKHQEQQRQDGQPRTTAAAEHKPGSGKYEDIINLPHPVSKRHTPMPMQARAAQFAPFAALNGHGEAIRKKAEDKAEEYEADSLP